MRLLASPLLAALALSAALAATGCSKDNPNFCEGVGCDAIDAAIDSPIDAPVVGCDQNPGLCTGSDLNCVLDVCRDCDPANNQQDADCTEAAAPICGANNDCRSCTAHAECAKGVCFNGTCPDNVLFVAPTGNNAGGNQCTDVATPCQTLTHAIATRTPPINGDIAANRRFIRLLAAADYPEPGAVTIDDRAVWIIGPAGADRAVIDRSGNGPTLVILNGAEVRLERIGVYNGANNAMADGITCAGSTLTAHGIEVHSNEGTGIVSDSCQLTLNACVISNNVEGGLSVIGGRAVIVNNTIVGNGGSISTFGGVYLAPSVDATSVVQSNTVVNNISSTVTESNGIDCRINGLIARNNIVFGDGSRPRVNGVCTHHNTLYGPTDPGLALGVANGNQLVVTDSEFKFQDPGARNYHLRIEQPPSVAKDKGSATGIAPEAMTDLDGEARPQGTADVGCDEIP